MPSPFRWRRWCKDTLCATFSGLSKVYRACGFRVGWVVFSGDREHAQRYLEASTCWHRCVCAATCRASGRCRPRSAGFQSIRDLVRPGGRLFESRQALIDGVRASRYLTHGPAGRRDVRLSSGVDRQRLPDFDDQDFALELLEKKHVLIAPGTSFNTPYNNYFRVTNLPDPATLAEVFRRMEDVLEGYAMTRPAGVAQKAG